MANSAKDRNNGHKALLPPAKVIEVHPDLVGLKGGKKQFWLRINRGEVELFESKHGREATLTRFNMSLDTYERFQGRKGREETPPKRLSENDRWVYTTSMESIRELRREVRDLQEWREKEATPVIRVGQAFLNATMGFAKAKVEESAVPEYLLNLRNSAEKVESRD